MQYLMLLGATILLAADFSVQKIYQKIKGTSPAASLGFNSLLGLFTVIIFLAINGFKVGFTVCSFAMAALVNGLVTCYSIIGFKLLEMGTVATYTLFLMSGGMTVPYIFGLLFLNEPFSALKTAALIIILAGVVLSNFNDEKIGKKQIIMCAAVFFLNGFVSTVSKLHQTDMGFETVGASDFVLLGGIFKFAFAGILYLFAKKEKQTSKATHITPLFLAIASAAAGGISYMLQLFGAASLPATVLYPFITGGSIVASSLAGVIFFKDRLSRNLIVGIALCFIGTLMFL